MKDMKSLINKVLNWAYKKEILIKVAKLTQTNKVLEEVEEIKEAVENNNKKEIKDGIGDTLVTLIILSDMYNWDISECLQKAYNEIKNRKGMIKNGMFIKDKNQNEIYKKNKIVARNRKHLEQLLERSRRGEIKLDEIDVSNVEDMSYLFYGFSKEYFNGSIENWDVSNVENMEFMFFGSDFNQDISDWDVSNVKSMSYMFTRSDFNRDISNWNVLNVKHMRSIFAYSDFNQDISNWNVLNIKDMAFMFAYSKFNQDISWDVSKIENVRGMFKDCPIKKEHLPYDKKERYYMMFGFKYKNQNKTYKKNKIVARNRKHLDELLEKSIKGRIRLDEIDVSNIEDMSYLFYGFSKKDFNGSIENWDVSNVKDMHDMFAYSEFNQDISSWDVSNVENMEYMFAGSDFNQDISNWDVSNVKNMSYMFANSQFNQDISNWNVIHIKDISHTKYVEGMFEDCPIEKEYIPMM